MPQSHVGSDTAIERDLSRVVEAVSSGGREWSDEIRSAFERIGLRGEPKLLPILREGEKTVEAERSEALNRLGESFPVRGGPLDEFEECSEERFAVLWGSVAEQSAVPDGDSATQAATGRLARVEQVLCALRKAIGGIAGRAFLAQLEAAEAGERRQLVIRGLAGDIPGVRVLAAREIAKEGATTAYEAVRELFARSSSSLKEELAPILAELDDREADRLLLAELLRLVDEHGPDAEQLFLGDDPWHSAGRSGREWARRRVFRATREAILKTGVRLRPAIIEEVRSRVERPSTAALVKLLVQIEIERHFSSDPARHEKDGTVLALLDELARSEHLPEQVRQAAAEGRSVLRGPD